MSGNMLFQPEKCGIVKRSILKQGGRYNSTMASIDYGERMLPLFLALQFARHMMDTNKEEFIGETPCYSGTKALLLRKSIASIPLEEIGGKFFIRISGKGFTELFELHKKFLAPEFFHKESQIILFSEGWKTRSAGQKTGITTLREGDGGAESYLIPQGKMAGQNEDYVVIDVKASDFPFLFGKGAAGDVRVGLPKGGVNGGNAAVGCGICHDGVIIPKFEWTGSVFVYKK
ncbi:MAG: hypothetical protein NTX79_01090 [Candidatus Micrarchaeota archaeon]|nr:hypothetical protein [Candidatus Micrarchaeota archaeon]